VDQPTATIVAATIAAIIGAIASIAVTLIVSRSKAAQQPATPPDPKPADPKPPETPIVASKVHSRAPRGWTTPEDWPFAFHIAQKLARTIAWLLVLGLYLLGSILLIGSYFGFKVGELGGAWATLIVGGAILAAAIYCHRSLWLTSASRSMPQSN
jgi:hypothetical protein